MNSCKSQIFIQNLTSVHVFTAKKNFQPIFDPTLFLKSRFVPRLGLSRKEFIKLINISNSQSRMNIFSRN